MTEKKEYFQFIKVDDFFNSGNLFIGEVYYGNDAAGNELGTTGPQP